MWTWDFLFQFKAFELNNDFFCFSGNVAAHRTDRLLFLLHTANRIVFTLSLRVNFNMYPTVYPNCLFQINEAHLGLTTAPIGHSTMLKLERDWADVSHVWTLTQTSLKLRVYAVLLSLLVCVRGCGV